MRFSLPCMLFYSMQKTSLPNRRLLLVHHFSIGQHFLTISPMIILATVKRLYEASLRRKSWLKMFLLNLIISNLLAFVHLLFFFFFYFFWLSSGPASYNNDEKTRLTYVLEHQPTSRRGYTCNARTEKREVFVPKVIESDDDRLLHLNSIHTEMKEKFCILFHPFQ